MPLSHRPSTNLIETNFIEKEVDHKKDNDKLDQNKTFFSWLTNTKAPLIKYEELPPWLQDNNYIKGSYRCITHSYLQCVQSLFYRHNEFVNIWSHLIGAILFVTLSFIVYFYFIINYPTLKFMDFIVFYCFMVGAIVCLGLSSAFHTLCCHSEKVCANWNRCDYVGIVALISGSVIPVIFYGFYCSKILQTFYFSMILMLSAATTFAAVSPSVRRPEFRWFRTGLFIALGGSSIIPIQHVIIIYGFKLSFDVISLDLMVTTGILYVVGALLYGARIPERLFPGKCDIFFSSHQIFHVFVLSAAITHFYGVIQVVRYWHNESHGYYKCEIPIENMKPRNYL